MIEEPILDPNGWVLRNMVIHATYAPLARALCEGLAGDAGAGMFLTGLSATGAAPATHYASCGHVRRQFADMMTDANAIHAAAIETGAQVTLAQIVAMLAASDITDGYEESPFAAFERLGLQIVQEAM